jgi:predicted restriction endonuclease
MFTIFKGGNQDRNHIAMLLNDVSIHTASSLVNSLSMMKEIERQLTKVWCMLPVL